MEQSNKKKNSPQSEKKTEMPGARRDQKEGSKTSTSNRPEVNLPLKGGKADPAQASRSLPKTEESKKSEKKTVR